MALIPNPEFEALARYVESLRQEVLTILTERDELLYVVCPALESRYWLEIGVFETKTFELQLETLRARRKLELLQASLNREERPDPSEIDARLDGEFADYRRKLADEEAKIAAATNYSEAPFLSPEDSKRLKTLYRELVKSLHPDVATNAGAFEAAMLKKAISAYKRGDLAALETLAATLKPFETADQTPTGADETAFDELKKRRAVLQKARVDALADVERIKTTFPFDQRETLSDPNAVKARIAELAARANAFREALAAYRARIGVILATLDEE